MVYNMLSRKRTKLENELASAQAAEINHTQRIKCGYWDMDSSRYLSRLRAVGGTAVSIGNERPEPHRWHLPSGIFAGKWKNISE
jgi:hypothetical protein